MTYLKISLQAYDRIGDVASFVRDLRRIQKLAELALDNTEHAFRLGDDGKRYIDEETVDTIELLLKLYLQELTKLYPEVDKALEDLLNNLIS